MACNPAAGAQVALPDPEDVGFPLFSQLPEPIRRAVFQASWRDEDGWRWPATPVRTVLRLVSREACAAVDSVVTELRYHGNEVQAAEEEEDCFGVYSGTYATDSEDECADEVEAVNDGPARQALLAAGGGARFRLSALHLAATSFTLQDVATLQAGSWPCLETLHLETIIFHPHAARELARGAAGALPALRELHIVTTHSEWPKLGDAGAKALAKGRWPSLTCLDLGLNDLSVVAAAALAKAGQARFPALEILALDENKLGDAGARVLVALAGAWQRLQLLNLQNNAIGDAGAKALAAAGAAGRLPALQELVLRCNYDISNQGMRALTTTAWPHLESLQCGDLSVGGDAVEALAAAGKGKFPALRDLELDLPRDDAGQRLRDALAAAWPGIKLATHNTEYY